MGIFTRKKDSGQSGLTGQFDPTAAALASGDVVKMASLVHDHQQKQQGLPARHR